MQIIIKAVKEGFCYKTFLKRTNNGRRKPQWLKVKEIPGIKYDQLFNKIEYLRKKLSFAWRQEVQGTWPFLRQSGIVRVQAWNWYR